MRRSAAVVAAVALALALAASGSARAQQSGPARPVVRVEVDACAGVAPDEVARLVALELESAPDAGAPSRDATLVHVGCAADESSVLLRVDDAVTGKSVERAVAPPVTLDPRARARLLALAVAELVTSSWTELATSASLPLPPARPLASPAARRAALRVVTARVPALARPRRALDGYLALAATARLFVNSGAILPTAGGAIRLGVDARAGFGVGLDFDISYARRDVDLGRIDGVVASVAPLAWGVARLGGWSLRAGAGARLGFAELFGTPATPTRTAGGTVAGFWGGPLVTVGAGRVLSRSVRVDAWLEAGYAITGVDADVNARLATAADGVWTGFAFAIGFGP